jgi:hypothetical protein
VEKDENRCFFKGIKQVILDRIKLKKKKARATFVGALSDIKVAKVALEVEKTCKIEI